jgi:hypothetical protein
MTGFLFLSSVVWDSLVGVSSYQTGLFVIVFGGF